MKCLVHGTICVGHTYRTEHFVHLASVRTPTVTATLEVWCGVSDLTDIPIHVFRNSEGTMTVRTMGLYCKRRGFCISFTLKLSY